MICSWFGNPPQKVVPRSRISRSAAPFSYIRARTCSGPVASRLQREVGGIRLETSMSFCWLRKADQGPRFTGICVKHRGVRFQRVSRSQTVLLQQHSANHSQSSPNSSPEGPRQRSGALSPPPTFWPCQRPDLSGWEILAHHTLYVVTPCLPRAETLHGGYLAVYLRLFVLHLGSSSRWCSAHDKNNKLHGFPSGIIG